MADNYDTIASVYDRWWQTYLTRSTREALRRIPVPRAGMRVLDVGCGTGMLLEAMADRYPGCRFVGVDASEAMLRRAADRVTAGTELYQAPAEALPFSRDAFDVVVTSSSLHFWQDREGGMAEIARVLAPGGACVVTDWCADFSAIRLLDRYLRLTDRTHRPPLSSAALRALMENAGFMVETMDRYRITPLWGLMTARVAFSGCDV